MRSGRKETGTPQRPNSGWLRVSEVRFAAPNPFETKRNFGAHRGCVGVCEGKLAEGEMLETNRLGGEKRSPWGSCGNRVLERIAQRFDPLRQPETAALVSFWGALTLGGQRPRRGQLPFTGTS